MSKDRRLGYVYVGVGARAAAGEKKAGLAREFGISRETLYQYLREPEPMEVACSTS